MIPSDFNNHVPNEIGRALHEQCIKSMKDFVSLNKYLAKRDMRTCSKCHERFDLEDMVHRRYKGNSIYFCTTCYTLRRPRWMRGQGDEYRK